jgi:hypothetical protein
MKQPLQAMVTLCVDRTEDYGKMRERSNSLARCIPLVTSGKMLLAVPRIGRSTLWWQQLHCCSGAQGGLLSPMRSAVSQQTCAAAQTTSRACLTITCMHVP